jgi:hypothetical protein
VFRARWTELLVLAALSSCASGPTPGSSQEAQNLATWLLHPESGPIRLPSGVHPIGRVEIKGIVQVLGPLARENKDAAKIVGILVVKSGSLLLQGIQLDGRIEAQPGTSVSLKDVRIVGNADGAVSMSRANLTVEDATLAGPGGHAIAASHSVIVARNIKIQASSLQSGMRLEESEADLQNLDIDGAISQHLLFLSCPRVKLRSIRLHGGKGVGLLATKSQIEVSDLKTEAIPQFGLVLNQSRSRLSQLSLGRGFGFAIGIQGGMTQIEHVQAEPSADGVLSVSKVFDNLPDVEVSKSVLRHDVSPGILIHSGNVRLREVQFIGDAPGSVIDSANAVTVFGKEANLDATQVFIENPRDSGLAVFHGASASFSGSIIGAEGPGILLQSVKPGGVRLHKVRIQNLRHDVGIVLLDADNVDLRDLVIDGGRSHGILAKGRGRATVEDVEFRNLGGAAFCIEDASRWKIRGVASSDGIPHHCQESSK